MAGAPAISPTNKLLGFHWKSMEINEIQWFSSVLAPYCTPIGGMMQKLKWSTFLRATYYFFGCSKSRDWPFKKGPGIIEWQVLPLSRPQKNCSQNNRKLVKRHSLLSTDSISSTKSSKILDFSNMTRLWEVIKNLLERVEKKSTKLENLRAEIFRLALFPAPSDYSFPFKNAPKHS